MGKKSHVLIATLFVAVAGIVFLRISDPRDRIFRGKPESDWIQHLTYSDDAQAQQWKEFGPEGVEVLVRGLNKADRPFDRAYRKTYRKLPSVAGRFLPVPREDSTRAARMTLCDVLSRMGTNATIATPTMVRELDDENSSVRAIAISFFTWPEDQNAILNQMDKKEKRKLLPVFISALQDSGSDVRNNAALALGYYPEESQTVVPVLVKALQDPVPNVVRVAGNSLKRIDAVAAAKAGVK